MMTGCPNSKKVLTSTSLSRISVTVVWLTRPLLGVGALSWPLGSIPVDVGTLGALPFLGSEHCRAKCPTLPQLKHGALATTVF
jgi:hypothetical protein